MTYAAIIALLAIILLLRYVFALKKALANKSLEIKLLQTIIANGGHNEKDSHI